MPQKSVCFDVLGTCFGFEGAIQAIHDTFGARLRNIHVDPKTLFFSWFFAAQRDFTYMSLAGSYTPISQILKHTLRRACLIVDLPAEQAPRDEEIAAVMKAFTLLAPRPGLKVCYDGLRDAGFAVYGVTNGSRDTSLNYYHLADVELDGEHLISCDEVQAAKPDPKVYQNAQRHLDSKGLGASEGDRWFVAAHAWDLVSARKAGFKTAYLELEEHDPVTAISGKFDLYAANMTELLEKLRQV